jgi:Trypsin
MDNSGVETARVALIRYRASNGSSYAGSGLLINTQVVLTADHVADGTNHRVFCAEEWHDVTRVLRSDNPDIDIALMTLQAAITGFAPLNFARVNRDRIQRIEDCIAVGFPRWKRRGGQRVSAEVRGEVPTAEDLEEPGDRGVNQRFLTLLGNRLPPDAPAIRQGAIIDTGRHNPWGGMSGAAVISGDLIIGVVHSNNRAAGGQSLTLTPISAIDSLPDDKRQLFLNIVGVGPSSSWPALPAQGYPQVDETRGYLHDVLISYPRNGEVERWVNSRFLGRFKEALQEQLGQQKVSYQPPGALPTTNWDVPVSQAIRTSKTLLAVLSRQYFLQGICLAELESMIQRQVDEGMGTHSNPRRLVHAIVAHDCERDSAILIPEPYDGKLLVTDFKEWAYNHSLQGGRRNRGYEDALRTITADIAESAEAAPTWRPGFPFKTPIPPGHPTQGRPTI